MKEPKEKERKEKSTPLGVMTGGSVPRSSPRVSPGVTGVYLRGRKTH